MMASDNQYSAPVLACHLPLRGFAICSLEGKYSSCKIARKSEEERK